MSAAYVSHYASARKRCPECAGEGGGSYVCHTQVCGTIEDDETRAHFCATNCVSGYRDCRVCHGVGTLAPLQLAVYQARGGAAPVPLRGHA